MLNEETQQFVKKLGDKNLQLLRDQGITAIFKDA
jgi:hypothetical protein